MCIRDSITEKSGNLNLGTPGIMYLGGIASLIGAFFYENGNPNPSPVVGILMALICAIIASALGGLLFSFLTITLRANQNVTGLTLTILGSGIANFFGGSLNKLAGGVEMCIRDSPSAAFTSGAKLPLTGQLHSVTAAVPHSRLITPRCRPQREPTALSRPPTPSAAA